MALGIKELVLGTAATAMISGLGWSVTTTQGNNVAIAELKTSRDAHDKQDDERYSRIEQSLNRIEDHLRGRR